MSEVSPFASLYRNAGAKRLYVCLPPRVREALALCKSLVHWKRNINSHPPAVLLACICEACLHIHSNFIVTSYPYLLGITVLRTGEFELRLASMKDRFKHVRWR